MPEKTQSDRIETKVDQLTESVTIINDRLFKDNGIPSHQSRLNDLEVSCDKWRRRERIVSRSAISTLVVAFVTGIIALIFKHKI